MKSLVFFVSIILSASFLRANELYTRDSSDLVGSRLQIDCGSLTTHRSIGQSCGNDNTGTLDIIDAHSPNADTDDDAGEPFSVFSARSPTQSEADARKKVEDAALAIKWGMQNTWKDHVAAQKQVNEAKEARYKGRHDN